MAFLLRSARWNQSLLGGSVRSSFLSARPFTSSSIRSAEGEAPAPGASSPASDSPASDSPAPAAESAKDAAKFPPIFLSQRSPVYLKRIGRMVNNKAIRDFKRRLCVAEHENERMQYKAMTHDRNLPLEVRRYFESKLNALPKNSSITRVRNRCIITGRSRSVYRKFRMSRICLREMAGRHELMGLYKASW